MADKFADELAVALRSVLEKPVVLFPGAGIGKQANLKDWHEYLEYLADIAGVYEPGTADLMRKRVELDLFPEAAHLYKTCPLIPEGERWAKLAAPFLYDQYDPAALTSLVSLPFKAIITTNYDRSLHDAVARVRHIAPRPLELDDNTLQQGQYLDEFYIARIHGRAEIPPSIVIDTDDYKRLDSSPAYLDLLIYALTQTSCLFVGFSFLDPAIKKVLQVYAQRVGPTFPRSHTAILPDDAALLTTTLLRLNINVLSYPPGRHDLFWEALSRAATPPHRKLLPPASSPTSRPIFDTIKRFLASCYVRLKLAQEIQPLRSLVLDGLMLGLITDFGASTTVSSLTAELRSILSLTELEVGDTARRAIASLVRRGFCRQTNEVVELVQIPPNSLEEDLRILVSGVLHRLEVREGIHDAARERPLVRAALEELLLERGWDLGAHFAAARSSDTFDMLPIVRASVERHGPTIDARLKDRIVRACWHLVHNPDDTEALILTELGRLSFGIDITIERPRGTLLWSTSIPTRVYLDASIVMPLIVPGHPKGLAYAQALTKLKEAGDVSGVTVRILVANVFLNEILSHRNLSREAVMLYGLENPGRLRDYVGFEMGRENVFLISYAATKMTRADLSYADFLAEVAPYETEDLLRGNLAAQGIIIERSGPQGEEERTAHNRLRIALHKAYGEDEGWRDEKKPRILIDHEAVQLWQLSRDARRGERSVFVTADVRLRGLVSVGELGTVGSLVLSPLALIQLVDLLVGVRAEGRSFARLMWGVRALGGFEMLREHFMTIGLRQYFEEALAKGVPELVEMVSGIATDAREAAERDGVGFAPVAKRDIQRALNFLQEFGDRFYEQMAREIRRHQE